MNMKKFFVKSLSSKMVKAAIFMGAMSGFTQSSFAFGVDDYQPAHTQSRNANMQGMHSSADGMVGEDMKGYNFDENARNEDGKADMGPAEPKFLDVPRLDASPSETGWSLPSSLMYEQTGGPISIIPRSTSSVEEVPEIKEITQQTKDDPQYKENQANFLELASRPAPAYGPKGQWFNERADSLYNCLDAWAKASETLEAGSGMSSISTNSYGALSKINNFLGVALNGLASEAQLRSGELEPAQIACQLLWNGVYEDLGLSDSSYVGNNVNAHFVINYLAYSGCLEEIGQDKILEALKDNLSRGQVGVNDFAASLLGLIVNDINDCGADAERGEKLSSQIKNFFDAKDPSKQADTQYSVRDFTEGDITCNVSYLKDNLDISTAELEQVKGFARSVIGYYASRDKHQIASLKNLSSSVRNAVQPYIDVALRSDRASYENKLKAYRRSTSDVDNITDLVYNSITSKGKTKNALHSDNKVPVNNSGLGRHNSENNEDVLESMLDSVSNSLKSGSSMKADNNASSFSSTRSESRYEDMLDNVSNQVKYKTGVSQNKYKKPTTIHTGGQKVLIKEDSDKIDTNSIHRWMANEDAAVWNESTVINILDGNYRGTEMSDKLNEVNLNGVNPANTLSYGSLNSVLNMLQAKNCYTWELSNRLSGGNIS